MIKQEIMLQYSEFNYDETVDWIGFIPLELWFLLLLLIFQWILELLY